MMMGGRSSEGYSSLLLLEAVVGATVVALLLSRQYGAAATVTFGLAAAAVGFTAWMVFKMLSSLSDASYDMVGQLRDFATERLEAEKQLVLLGIKDLEIEYATGKMDEANYQSLRQSAEAKAAALITALKQQERVWKSKAEQLAAQRLNSRSSELPEPSEARALETELATEASKLVCEACGFENPVHARFCGGCGRPMKQELP